MAEIADAINTFVPNVNQESQGNATQQSGAATSNTLGVGGKQAQENLEQLQGTTEGAEQATEDIAGIKQQYGVPASQQAYAQAQAVAAQQAQIFQDIQNNAKTVNTSLNYAQDQLNSALQEAQSSPQQQVWGKFFGDSPVMSSIAMVLGGIGSGITGQPNAAIEMLNQAVAGATQKKSQQIAAYMDAAQQAQGIAGQTLASSQIESLANNMASATVLHATNAGLDYNANLINNASALYTAQILKNGFQQQLTNTTTNFATNLRNQNTFTDSRRATGTAQLIYGGTHAALQNRKAIETTGQKIYGKSNPYAGLSGTSPLQPTSETPTSSINPKANSAQGFINSYLEKAEAPAGPNTTTQGEGD